METLGVWLRQTREGRDETLTDVQVATRIKARFLEMLEGGEFDAFPGGEVQVRGFLRIYARHLGLAPEQVLSRYEEETRPAEPVPESVPAEAPSKKQSTRPDRTTAPAPASVPLSGMPSWLSLETIIIASIVLIVVLVIAIAILLIVSQNRGAEPTPTLVSPTATSIKTSALPTVTVTLPAASPTFVTNPTGGVELTLEATEHVWARVTVDGITAFEGQFSPGQARSWSGNEEIAVDTGNGAGLMVTVNGQLQGVLGQRGQVSSRTWGPGGELVP